MLELEICIISACLLDFAFVAIMTNQYWVYTKGDHESNCIRDWRARKLKIARMLRWKIQNLIVTVSLIFFCDWLTDIEFYLVWYGFSDAARVLFARRKLIESSRSYCKVVERLHDM